MSRIALGQLRDVEYIGDAIYIGHDGYQVWLIHHDGIETRDAIALEDVTFEAMTSYRDRLKAKGRNL